MTIKLIRMSLLLDKDLKIRLQRMAKRKKIRVLPLIRLALTEWLEQEDLKHKLSK